VPTFLPCRRFFSLRSCSKAATDSLGGDLRVEEKRRRSQHHILFISPPNGQKAQCMERERTSPHRGKKSPCKWEPGLQGPGSGVMEPARECGAVMELCKDSLILPWSLPDFPSPLSGGSHPSGSLYSFWGQAPLGHQFCNTNQPNTGKNAP
jgi:hypothetical protein